MKKIIIVLSVLFTLNSCISPQPYYQEFKVNSIEGRENSDGIFFEDANCQVKYDFWSDGGNAGFEIFNKTETDIVLDLTNSFFVKNGFAYPYYQNRIFSSSSRSTVESTFGVSNFIYRTAISSQTKSEISSTSGTEFIESTEVIIPKKTTVSIVEFSIEVERYKNCDLKKYPAADEIQPMQFNTSDSPIVFKNIIVYKTGANQNKIEQNFFISEIKNSPEKGFMIKETKDRCGRKYSKSKLVFRNADANRFYLKYF